MKIKLRQFFYDCYFKPIIVVAPMLVFGLRIRDFYNINNWTTLILVSCVIVIVYLTIIYLFVLNSNDKRLIKEYLRLKKKHGKRTLEN